MNRKQFTTATILLLLFALTLAACQPTPTPSPTSTPSPTPSPTPPPTATTEPTPTPTPTPSSPLPTPTTVSPLPTPTIVPGTAWHAVARSSKDAWATLASELNASVVELRVRLSDTDTEIIAALDNAQALGLQVLVHIYDGSTASKGPWSLEDDTWTVSPQGIEILTLIEGHPAVWAVYQLEEPWGSGYDADAQRALYSAIKAYAPTTPLYTDLGSLYKAVEVGDNISDGMCDWCCTAPTVFRGEWTSEQCITETFTRMDADLAAQREFMPGSQLIFMFNIYQLEDGARYRLPTEPELIIVRDYTCNLEVPALYYPWYHGSYEITLKDAPHLWPAIAAGCNGSPPPTPTISPTISPTSSPTPTQTPTPISTPDPDQATIIIDHTTTDPVDLYPDQLDAARQLIALFTHKSIGNNILDGIADLQTQDPGRYTIQVTSSSGTRPGINHVQPGSNSQPLTKISGFRGLIQSGHDLAMMKFCTGDIPCVNGNTPIETMWTEYRDAMETLIQNHPNTTIVWWTIPTIANNHSRAHCNQEMAWFNDQVRTHVAINGGTLFDIANIESHDEGGNPVTWNDIEAGWPGWTSDGAHLNEAGRQRVAGALWHLLARLADQ